MTSKVPSASQAEDLVGARLRLEDVDLKIQRVARRHPDYSITFVCETRTRKRGSGGRRETPVLLFVRMFTSDPELGDALQRARMAPSRGLSPYYYVGTPAIETAAQHLWSPAWATARPYETYTLDDVLVRDDSGQSLDSYSMIVDLAFGLRELHSRGLVHRDIRPANIVFDETHSEARLVDYGVPKRLPAKPRDELAYLAPEQLAQTAHIEPSADVYAFGKIVRRVRRNLWHSSRPDMLRSNFLDWVVLECLRIDPDDRPTMDELVDLLDVHSEPKEIKLDLVGLLPAVIADIDGRLPEMLDRHQNLMFRVTGHVLEKVQEDVWRYSAHRMAWLDRSALVHLLATLSISQMADHRELAERSRNRVMINSVEYSRLQLNLEAAGQQAPSGGDPLEDPYLDWQWAREIRALALAGDANAEPTAWQRDHIDRQLAGARRLTKTILDATVFVQAEDVAAIMAESCPGITLDEVRLLRDLGYLLALPYKGEALYPKFQFDRSSGMPYDCVKAVSDVQEGDASAWRRGIWWFLESPQLDGMSPMDWLDSSGQPNAVISTFVDPEAA